MAVIASETGRFGNITINTVAIAITHWTCKVHKEFAVSTDSSCFDSGTGQTWRARKPGEVWLEGTIEGNYDFGGTTDANFTQKMKVDGPFPMVLKFDETTTFASGNFDFDEVEYDVQVPGANMITFRSPFQSNGVPTLP